MADMIKRRLNIAQVAPGMKLAEPITNAAGITLMPAGIRLTPMFIIRLKKWNIVMVDVFTDSPAENRSETSVTRVKRRASGTTSATLTAEQSEFARLVAGDVSKWFVNVRENPLMMQLRNIVIKRLVAHGKTGMINLMRRPGGYENVNGTAENGA